MNRLLGFSCLVLSLSLISACGGGGGGSNSSSGDSGGSSGSATPATITRSNAKLLAQAALAPRAISDGALSEIASDFSYFHSLASGQSGSSLKIDSSSTCSSGSITFSGTVSATDNTGDVTITSNNCYTNYSSEAITYSGKIHMVLRAVDSSGNPTAFDFNYQSYRTDSTNPSGTLISSGVLDGTISMSAQNTINATLTLKDLQSGDTVSTTDYHAIYTSFAYPFSAQRSGHVNHSRLGAVTLDTDTQNSNVSIITGANRANIRATASAYNYGYYDLALDENGDGNYDSFASGFAGSFDTIYASNTAPSVNVYYADIQPGLDQAITIPLNGIYDNESDFLSYSARALQSPNNVDIGFTLSENKTLSFHTHGAGDYVIELKVDDGNGGVTTQNISFHVSLPEPLITPVYNSNLNAGDNFTVNLQPINSDAGPFTYKLNGAPAGMTIDTNGVVHWQTSQSFFPAMDVQATVQISNADHTIAVPLQFNLHDANKSLPLTRTNPAGPMHAKNTFVLDFNNDGGKEILTTDNNVAVFTMKYSNGTYTQDWMYPYALGKSNIDYIYPFDLDHNGRYEIAVQAGGTISIIDETHGSVVRSTELTVTGVQYYVSSIYAYGISVADIDNDGKQEIIAMIGVGGTNQIVVLDAATLTEKWRTAALSLGNDFAIGNTDNDSALEIITSGGYVFDGATQTNEWLYTGPFGSSILVGDVDGDGIDEILGVNDYPNNITAFSAVSKTQLWSITSPTFSFSAVQLAQLDADAAKEIIAVDNLHGAYYVYDATHSSTTLVWSANSSPIYNWMDMAVGDANADNVTDVILSGYNGLQIFDTVSRNVTFNNSYNNVAKSFAGGLVTSINGASLALFATSSPYYYYSNQQLIGLDLDHGTIQSGPSIYYPSSSPGMCLADYDNDGTAEVFITASSTNSSSERAMTFDFATSTKEWSRTSSSSSYWYGLLTCGDFNNDGHIDVAGNFDGPLEIDDPTNKNQIWTDSKTSAAQQITNADLDGDGKPELITFDQGYVKVYKRNGASYQQSNSYAVQQNYYYYSAVQLSVNDIDGDGKPEIIVAVQDTSTTTNTILVVLNSDLTERSRVSVSGTIDVIAPEAIGIGQILIAIHYTETDNPNYYWGTTRYRVEAIDTNSGNWIWRAPQLLALVNPNSLHIYNAGSANPRIVIGTQSAAIITR